MGSEPNACPPIVEYSDEEQDELADELVKLEPENIIIEFLSDYAVMRDQARICRE